MYRLGIIGAGAIGRLHAESAARAGVDIAAFCDLNLGAAEEAASLHPEAVAVGDVDALLALNDVPAVIVAVPNAAHAAVAIQALDAGKKVLLEKPMALSTKECDEIIAARDRSGSLLQLGFVCRCAPTALEVARLAALGRFGTIYHAKAMLLRRRGIPGLGGWFTQRSKSGGGVLIDLGVHLVDVALHLLGRPDPQRVSALCTSHFGHPIERYVFSEMWAGPPRPEGVFDVEDGAHGLIRVDGGATIEMNTTWAANMSEKLLPNGIFLFGDAAGCYLDLWTGRLEIFGEEHDRVVDVTPELPPGDQWNAAWTKQHEVFADLVVNDGAATATGEHGRQVQAVLEGMYRSSAEGREVEVEQPGLAS